MNSNLYHIRSDYQFYCVYVFLPVFKSCKELSKCESQDGEYYLQLQFPICNQSVRVYCADMSTNDPKEYVTLNSGEENNFSHLDNTMSPDYRNRYGSTTKFSKVGFMVGLTQYCSKHCMESDEGQMVMRPGLVRHLR